MTASLSRGSELLGGATWSNLRRYTKLKFAPCHVDEEQRERLDQEGRASERHLAASGIRPPWLHVPRASKSSLGIGSLSRHRLLLFAAQPEL